MSGLDRKAAVAAYKKRDDAAGIFVVRDAVTGAAWVGQTPDLQAIWNRFSFSLRLGGHPCRSLQDAWHAHGAASLTFAVLEQLEPEESPYIRKALLKQRCAHWRAELGAGAV